MQSFRVSRPQLTPYLPRIHALVKAMIKRVRTADGLLPTTSAATSISTSASTQPGAVFDAKAMGTVDYWLGHDVNTNNVANGGWLLHARRERVFSIAAARAHLRGEATAAAATTAASAPAAGSGAGAVMRALFARVVQLCCHEYDVIRGKALKGCPLSTALANP